MWNFVGFMGVVIINLGLAFLAILTYRLRARFWPIVAVMFVASVLTNIFLPSPSVLAFVTDSDAPPAAALRVAQWAIGGGFGVYGLWEYLDRKQWRGKR